MCLGRLGGNYVKARLQGLCANGRSHDGVIPHAIISTDETGTQFVSG